MAANNSLLDTNLSTSPYFDDYDPAKNFAKILFKPRTAVQTRELNQIQSILQNQISIFGKDIYKDGSVIGGGCQLTYDNSYSFVKLNDTYANSTALTVSSLDGLVATNARGLRAKIINTVQGLESKAPDYNTIFVKYLNTSLSPYANGVYQTKFDANEQLSFYTDAGSYQGNVVTASPTVAATVSGYGYAITVGEGIIFKKGYFVNVPKQTLVVDKYYNIPDNVSVGFGVKETIVTASSDSSLFDNAAGSPNFTAPGADRLKLDGVLEVRQTNLIDANTFFSIVDFKNGYPVTNRTDAQFNSIQKELARRTYETNGNFVVEPFVISSMPLANTQDADYATHYNAMVSRGLGYVDGYRVEFINNTGVKARRGVDTNGISQQEVSLNFGYYVKIKELSGSFSSSSEIVPVEIHNVAKTSITSRTLLSTSYSATTKIGTAYIKGIAIDNNGLQGSPDCQYRLYLFNLTMNPGANFRDVKSVIFYESSTLKAVADVITTKNFASDAQIAKLENSNLKSLIFPFGQNALTQSDFNNMEFKYRKVKTATINKDTSIATIGVDIDATATSTDFLYSGSSLSGPAMNDFIVVPTSNGYSDVKTGTITTHDSACTTITGASGTNFITQYEVGDFIYANNTARRIVGITSACTAIVDADFGGAAGSGTAHQKVWLKGNPIPFAGRANRSMSIVSNSLTIDLGENANAAFNVQILHSLSRKGAKPIKKNINKTVFVKIDCSTHENGHIGPWCLGIPDVLSIDGVYVDNSGDKTYSNTTTNRVSNYVLDNGQRESHYDLAYMSIINNTIGDNLTADTTILVQLTAFTYNSSQGVGYFVANSYPVDDINFMNSDRMATYQIPVYNSPVGVSYNLRDSVDFRPYATNTAAISTTINSAYTNPPRTLSFNYTPYLPVPDSLFQSDLAYYLRRIDRVSLDIAGNIIITEGKPSSGNPAAPPEKQQTMTLGLIKVSPFPSLTSSEAAEQNRYDIAIQTQMSQNKRYTMKDIGQFDKRIKNLEYYTSLSMLESSAASLQVRSTSTGLNRFQNGIFVDPFNGFDLSNTRHPKFFIAIDPERTELRPSFVQIRSEFDFNQSLSDEYNGSQKVAKYGSLVMLKHTTSSIPYIQQKYATKYRNVIDANLYHYRGTVKLTPNGSQAPDITKGVQVLDNVDNYSNWAFLAEKAWGTQWGNWVTQYTNYANTIISAASIKDEHYNASGQIDTTTIANRFNNTGKGIPANQPGGGTVVPT
jgi:hypothetical protein